MGKVNPRQVNLSDVAKTERPKQLAINKSLETDPYGVDKLKPEGGSVIDQSTRTTNLAINIFSEKDPYQVPSDL